MENLNSVIGKILFDLGFENLYYCGILKKNWDKIVGELISKVCSPDRIEREVLFIKCNNPAWKQELYFFKEEIIQKVNVFLKKNAITNIKIYFG